MTTNLNKIRKASVYRSGTFWHEQVSPDQRELVRVLFHAIDQGNAELGLQTIPAKLTPSAWVDVWHTEIRFDTSKSLSLVLNPGTRAPIHDREFEPLPVPRVFEHDHVAGLVLDAPDDMEYWEEPQGVILVPYELETTRWAEFGYTPYSYLVRHTGVQPTTILSPSGLLFSGLDFKNTELGLIFKEDPAILFPNSIIHVRHGLERVGTTCPYSSSVDPTDTPGTLINRYLRTTQSPLDLQAALNEVIGLDGFYETCAVLEYYPCQDGSVIYLTDKGQVEIKQPHIPIAPGTTVQAATVPGQIIRCFCHATHGPDWYKFFDVPVNGIPASTLLPRALSTDRIPAGPILVEQDGDHARLYTGTSFGAQGTFDLMRSIADAQDSTSFSQYVLDNTEDGKFDFLNFLFEHVWLHTGLAVVYDSNRVTPVDIQRVQDFLHRNQPLNAVTFVIPE